MVRSLFKIQEQNSNLGSRDVFTPIMMRDMKRKKSVTTKQILKHVTGKVEALPLIKHIIPTNKLITETETARS